MDNQKVPDKLFNLLGEENATWDDVVLAFASMGIDTSSLQQGAALASLMDTRCRTNNDSECSKK